MCEAQMIPASGSGCHRIRSRHQVFEALLEALPRAEIILEDLHAVELAPPQQI